QLTPLGIHLSHIPVDVHIGKMLLFGAIFRCLDPILTIAAMLSYRGPFLTLFGKESESDAARNKFKYGDSDLLTMYSAYCQWKLTYEKHGSGRVLREFCQTNFLNDQNLRMIEDMKKQFLSLLVNIGFVQVHENMKAELGRQVFLIFFIKFGPKTMCRVPVVYDANSSSTHIINAVIAAGLYPRVIHRDSKKNQFDTMTGHELRQVFIHPSSINFPLQSANASSLGKDWFVYNTMMQTNKLYVRETSLVEVVDLVLFGREVGVKHEIRILSIDKWIRLQCPAKTATLLKYLRGQLNKILKYKIDRPEAELDGEQQGWLDLILEVLESCEETNWKA
ncbi:11822_t:CDS:2, partial [Acaulospora morrowiae]